VYGICVTRGDSIVGIAGHRVSVFASSGAHVGTFANSELEFARFGCFEDGSLLATTSARRDPGNAAYRVTTARRIGLDGSDRGVVGHFPFGVSGSASVYLQTIPTMIPHGNHVLVGDGRRAQIQVYRADGGLIRIIRWNHKQIALTDELLTRIARAVHPDLTSDELDRRLARARAGELPRVLPAYAGFRVDETGRIWVQDYYLGRLLGNFPPQWTVFDSTGHPLGRAILPAIKGSTNTVDTRSFRRNTAAVTWKDNELNFPHLSFHQITSVR